TPGLRCPRRCAATPPEAGSGSARRGSSTSRSRQAAPDAGAPSRRRSSPPRTWPSERPGDREDALGRATVPTTGTAAELDGHGRALTARVVQSDDPVKGALLDHALRVAGVVVGRQGGLRLGAALAGNAGELGTHARQVCHVLVDPLVDLRHGYRSSRSVHDTCVVPSEAV